MTNTKQSKVLLYDRFNREIKSNLYNVPNNQSRPGKYVPRRVSQLATYDKVIDLGNRNELIRQSRMVYATMGLIRNAVNSIIDWSVDGGYDFVYDGVDDQDRKWGETVTNDYLAEKWANTCNVKGYPHTFKTSLKNIARYVLIDGDCLVVKQNGRWPMFHILEGHLIGSRNPFSSTKCEIEPFKGFPMSNGLIYGPSGRVIAYQILGDKKEDDYVLSTADATLVYNPENCSYDRGIPILAASILDCHDIEDVDDFIKQGIKLQANMVLIRKNVAGEKDPTENNNGLPAYDENGNEIVSEKGLHPPTTEYLGEPGVMYISHEDDMQAFNANDQPDPNKVEYIRRVEHRMLDMIGWTLYNLEEKGGASVRATEEIVRKRISSLQDMVTGIAKQLVTYSVAVGMKNGLIEKNYDNKWWSIGFTKAAQFSVDQGYSRRADLDDLRAGLITRDEIIAKRGKRKSDINKAQFNDIKDSATQAVELNKMFPQFPPTFFYDRIGGQLSANPTPEPSTTTDIAPE